MPNFPTGKKAVLIAVLTISLLSLLACGQAQTPPALEGAPGSQGDPGLPFTQEPQSTRSPVTPASVPALEPVSAPIQRPTATPKLTSTTEPTPTPKPTSTPRPTPTQPPATVDTPTVTPASEAGPGKSWATPNLEVSVVPDTLQVGETATVTIKVTGDGGLPKFYLNTDSNFLKAGPPEPPDFHSFRDPPQWTIEAVAVGTTSVGVSMTYETMICRNGECYFNYAGTGSPPVEVMVAPTPASGESATYTLHTSVEPFYSGGTLTLGPLPGPNGSYSAGKAVTLTASPSDRRACDSSPYWSFVGWSGNLGGSDPRVEITMDSNKTVAAVFNEFFPPSC